MSRRPERSESLDDTAWLDPAELAQNLCDLAAIKRWMGYPAEVWQEMCSVLRPEATRSAVVLDVATGGADLPAHLAAQALTAGLPLQVLGIDLHPQVAAEAGRRTAGLPQVSIARADALRLPLDSGSVDVALCSFTLHHFAWEQARALLAELQRTARLGVIVSDFLRSGLAYWATWALTRLWGPRHRLSRRDGPLSIRRAYRAEEVQRLAAEAGLAQPLLLRRLPFRFTLLAPGPAFVHNGDHECAFS